MRAASKEKWLESHGIEHWTEFYTEYGVALQKKFFGHYLKDEDTGWKDQPRVLLKIRHPGEKFVERAEDEWPIARTNWTKLYLQAEGHLLGEAAPAEAGSASYAGLSDGVTFVSPPLKCETENHGPPGVEALGVLKDRGRRPVPGAQGFRAGFQGSHLPGRARPPHTGGPGLAPGLAPQAR